MLESYKPYTDNHFVLVVGLVKSSSASVLQLSASFLGVIAYPLIGQGRAADNRSGQRVAVAGAQQSIK